jgi:TorA maturation chaperone TorD
MELFRALAAMLDRPGPELARLGDIVGLGRPPTSAEHTELFVLELHPYASVQVGADGMLGGAARDRVAGFWRALGLTPPPEPDHLATLLSFHARLLDLCREEEQRAAPETTSEARDPDGSGNGTAEAGRGARWRHARRVFFWEHIASWVFPYLDRVDDLASDFYAGWASLLRAALIAEASAVGPPELLPVHLRTAPPMPAASEGDLNELTAAFLTPVRSGGILARSDLVRAARALGVGVRAGERRFMLRALLGEDAAGAFGWLSAEFRRRAVVHRGGSVESCAGIASFWEERAIAASRTARDCHGALHPYS